MARRPPADQNRPKTKKTRGNSPTRAQDGHRSEMTVCKRLVCGGLANLLPWRLAALPISNQQRLRRNTIRECVGMKISVVTHARPGTILLGCLGHTVFLTGGEIIPRIVASDG